MKKIGFALFLLIGCLTVSFGAEAAAVAAPAPAAKAVATSPAKWTPFQIGFFFDFPTSTTNSNVYGIKTGQPIVSGNGIVRGLEASWFVSGTDHIEGLQLCWVYNQSKTLKGIQSSFLASMNTQELIGLQATLGFCMAGNVKGAQGGVVCISEDFQGLQAAAVMNKSGDIQGFQAASVLNITGDVTGFQASVVTNLTGNLTGFQTSLLNKAEESKGVQFGVINIAKKTGLQFGLINYIEDGFLPFFPVVNFSL